MSETNIVNLIDNRIKQELAELEVQKSNEIKILHEDIARKGQVHGTPCIMRVQSFCSQEIKDAVNIISKIINEFIKSSGVRHSDDLSIELKKIVKENFIKIGDYQERHPKSNIEANSTLSNQFNSAENEINNQRNRGLEKINTEIDLLMLAPMPVKKKTLNTFYEETDSVTELDPNNQEVNQMPDPKKVFVVHGRDSRLRDDFFSFLRALGLQPIEWSEALKLTRKATPYIGEALDSAFKNAQAVIVLLTPDDEVRLSPELWKKNEDEREKTTILQARPNVLFEAGMAFGIHSDRTLLVEVGQVKAFSDVAGRHIVKLSNSPDSRNDIAERLRTSGCDVSTSGNDWLKTGDFVVTRATKSATLAYAPEDLTEADIIALLDNWWPKLLETAPENVTVNYREVDQSLSLPSGSTKKYISKIASRKSFKPVSSGNVVATFEYDINSENFGTFFEPGRD